METLIEFGQWVIALAVLAFLGLIVLGFMVLIDAAERRTRHVPESTMWLTGFALYTMHHGALPGVQQPHPHVPHQQPQVLPPTVH
jgi:ABC-type Fe3+-siderophore transport system permease subunit